MKKPAYIGWAVFGIVLTCAAAGVVAATSHAHHSTTDDGLPTTQVLRGDFNIRVHATGELSPSHAVMLSAPTVAGGALQITRLAATGSSVKKGDVVIEFDPNEQRYKLEQSRSELLQAEQEITKADADAAVVTAQDKVSLLKARYDVRRAELDVQKDELVSSIDARKNELALQQAKRVLAELEKDIQSHTSSGQASLALAREKHNKAKLAMDQAQQNIGKMQVTAPLDGLFSVQKNMDAAGGIFFTGMSLPDYHAGDQAAAGSAIAQVVDPMGLELTSKISEKNHNNIKQGQPVLAKFDAIPAKEFRGTVKTLGGMAVRQFFEANTGGNFDVTIQLADPDPRLRSGFTAQIEFLGSEQKSVLYLPLQAIFLKDGKRVVFVKSGNGYDQREVKVVSASESRAAIEGLSAGMQVALVDPTAPRKSSSAPGTAPAGSGATP